MTKSNISRRSFIEGGVGLTVANHPRHHALALAASMEEAHRRRRQVPAPPMSAG